MLSRLFLYTVYMHPTVQDVLDLPVTQSGEPEVLIAGGLDRPVRWVHVSDLSDLSDLLEGGELVLTTGQALADPEHCAEYLPGLAKAGAVGVVVELGTHIDAMPNAAMESGVGLDLTVIVLHRAIRFVQLTEAVHRLIVADQLAEVEYARKVHEAFNELNIRRASLDEIVAAAAEMVQTPVVLEDLNHQVLAFSGMAAARLLTDWERRSRLAGASWLARPVGPYRQEWGRLVAPVGDGNERAAMTLDRAAQALTLHRMVERDRSSLELRAQSGLVDDLRTGRMRDEAEATARAHALGLRPALTYVPMTARLSENSSADQVLVQQRRIRAVDAMMHAIRAGGQTALASGRDDGQIDLLLARQHSRSADVLSDVCAAIHAAVARVDGVRRCVIGVGPESSRLVDAAGGLGESAHVAEVAMAMPDEGRPFFRASDLRLRGLVSALRDDPRVQAFAETELGGLLRHRAIHGASEATGGIVGGDDSLALLRRYLESGGNKSELAKQLHMSRPTLYARLETLGRLVGADLDDAESRASLHVALLVLDTR